MTGTTNEAADAVAVRLFTTPEGRRDPYPLYHELRRLDPVHRSSLGMWLVTRYDDVSAVARDPRFGKDFGKQMQTTVGPSWQTHPAITNRVGSMLNIDGAAHARLRSRVIGAFKRRKIDALRQDIERYVDSLLDPYAEAGGGDLLEAVAFPLPVYVIGEMLGVPETDRAQFRQLVSDLVAIFEVGPSDEMMASADAAEGRIRSYFLDLIAEKRRSPDDKILSQLANDPSEDPMTDDEVCDMASLLFGAGFETTTNLLGNSVWGLLQQPEQVQKLRDEPALFQTLPDELLRYDGTAQAISRYTVDDVDLGGVTIPAGESVMALLGAGNHDPAQFERPDEIDVMRERFRPLSLGGGIHFCLGASLAKAEIEITVRGLFDRFEKIELAGAAPRFRDRLILRGLESLHLKCDVAKARARTPLPAIVEEAVSVTTPVSSELPEANASSARPLPGTGADDAAWRNALRARVESRPDSGLVRSGSDLLSMVVLLARAGLFARCTPAEIEELAATAYPLSFEPGERLTIEGAESLRPRSATVTALSDMITYAISRERLLALADRSPNARQGMLDYIRESYDD
ncbi:MAG: cytochrome P450 [Deltaproteobacteria bacterium]|nr:cytochrome P450 [Deltaproteobacteria bacterium]